MTRETLIWVSDWDISRNAQTQSGYGNISSIFATQLAKEYNIIALGISYRRNQHFYPFSITHVQFPQLLSAIGSIKNGIQDPFKNVIVALDIPMQIKLADGLNQLGGLNHVGIMAVEGDPIIMSVAMNLMKVNKRLIISEFGTEECKKVGIPCSYLPIPIDIEKWKMRKPEDKNLLKSAMGLGDKTVFFMNADANERKAISTHYEALEMALKKNPNLYFVLLTRKDSPVSWNLDDLAMQFNVVNNVMVIDRGISEEEIWKLYAMSDYYINCTKAEGLCLGILEAMSVGVPCIATNCTAMKDSLKDGRGILVDAGFITTDVFLNTRRYYVLPKDLAEVMLKYADGFDDTEMITKARNYVESKKLDTSLSILKENLL